MKDMSPKKILIFSLAYFPKHVGGAEIAIKEITNRLPKDEYEFHLICNRYDSTLAKEEKVGEVYVHRIGLVKNNPDMADLRRFPLHLNKLIFQFLAYFKAKKLHQEIGFDMVWAMMAHASGVPAGLFKKKFPNVEYVLTLQEGDPINRIEARMKVFGQYFDNAFLLADKIQVISNYLGNWAFNRGYTGPILLIPNAVDTKQFAVEYTNEERYEVRQKFRAIKNDVLLVTTSRLVPKNAIDIVIRSLSKLPPHVKLVVFGTGPEGANLRHLADELDLNNRIFWGGQLENDLLPKYLKACDIFIRPSRSEGMGISFIEAMASGLPVVATQEGGIADFLYDEKRNPDKPATGWAVDVDSPEDIIRAVNDIIDNPQKVEKVVTQARQLVTERYDWDLVAKKMQEELF